MKVGEAIKEMAHRARLTQKALAEKAGYKTSSSVTTPIAKNDLMVSTLIRLANVAGYDVALVRRHAVEVEYPIILQSKDGEPVNGANDPV